LGLGILKIAAWAVFAADALIVLLFFRAGIAASDPVGYATTLAFALIAALSLGGLFGIVFVSARNGSRVGLSAGLVLGGVPLALLAEMIGEQHGLWPRM
jgi:hypothetical protein